MCFWDTARKSRTEVVVPPVKIKSVATMLFPVLNSKQIIDLFDRTTEQT